MDNYKFEIIGFILFCILGYFEYWKHNKPCKKCGGKRKVIKVKDLLGKNLTKTVTIGIDLGSLNPKKLIKYKCESCSDITNEKRRY